MVTTLSTCPRSSRSARISCDAGPDDNLGRHMRTSNRRYPVGAIIGSRRSASKAYRLRRINLRPISSSNAKAIKLCGGGQPTHSSGRRFLHQLRRARRNKAERCLDPPDERFAKTLRQQYSGASRNKLPHVKGTTCCARHPDTTQLVRTTWSGKHTAYLYGVHPRSSMGPQGRTPQSSIAVLLGNQADSSGALFRIRQAHLSEFFRNEGTISKFHRRVSSREGDRRACRWCAEGHLFRPTAVGALHHSVRKSEILGDRFSAMWASGGRLGSGVEVTQSSSPATLLHLSYYRGRNIARNRQRDAPADRCGDGRLLYRVKHGRRKDSPDRSPSIRGARSQPHM